MNLNRTFYRQPSQIVPGVRSPAAFAVLSTMYPHPKEREILRVEWHVGHAMLMEAREKLRNRAARRIHNMQAPIDQFPADYDGSRLYKFHMTPNGMQLPAFIETLQAEEWAERVHQARMQFALAMEMVSSRDRTIPRRYDLFLVYLHRVLNQPYFVDDETVDANLAREFARALITYRVLDEGVDAAVRIAEAICAEMKVLAREDAGA